MSEFSKCSSFSKTSIFFNIFFQKNENQNFQNQKFSRKHFFRKKSCDSHLKYILLNPAVNFFDRGYPVSRRKMRSSLQEKWIFQKFASFRPGWPVWCSGSRFSIFGLLCGRFVEPTAFHTLPQALRMRQIESIAKFQIVKKIRIKK